MQGYIALAFTTVINLLLWPHLPLRKAAPLIEWKAFLEPTYILFAIGVFLVLFALYFCFFFFFITIFATLVVGLSIEELVNVLVVIYAVGILV